MVATPQPQRFGRFVLLDEAGAGAMGTVYAAYDPELDRRVALKVLHDHHAAHQARIRREAVAMARVSHPNVVQVYEVGAHDGQLFIAMEFVDGPLLTTWQSEVDDWAEIVRVYVAVGRGLAAAHRAGLVHRDFKPDNVLVGADGRPRVIDFGLARAPIGEGVEALDLAQGEGAELLASPLTRTGHLLGTPAYMAPEQFAGRVPTAASDQFAFAVALYEALYDQPPFPRDSLRALRRAVDAGLVEPPPRGRSVPALHSALVRALSPDPSRRWPGMDPLLDALSRYAANEEHRDWRKRFAAVLPTIAFVLGGRIVMRSLDLPRTSTDLLISEIGIAAALAIGVLIFLRVMGRTALNIRVAAWIMLISAAKTGAAAIGTGLALPPQAVYAFGTVILALMSAVAALMFWRGLWPVALLGTLTIGGAACWPDAAFLMHDLATAGIAAGAVWYLGWRPIRRASAAGPPRGLGDP